MKIPRLTIGDVISICAVVFGLVVLGIYIYDQSREYNFVDIKTPVELDSKDYKVGELVSGFFYGNIYTNNQPIVLRSIDCRNHRYSLTPVVVSSAKKAQLTGKKTSIVKLDSSSLSVKGAEFEPDTDCVINICSTYRVQPVFGNIRSLNECYFTESFNIVAKDKKLPKPKKESNQSKEVQVTPAVPIEVAPQTPDTVQNAPIATPELKSVDKPVIREQPDFTEKPVEPAKEVPKAPVEPAQPERKGIIEQVLEPVNNLLRR